jgi:hypothetical protein
MIKLTYERKNSAKGAAKQALRSAKEQTETRVERILSAGKPGKPATTAETSAPNCADGSRLHQVIKLGVDVHLDRYVVVRQIDGGAPQPPQRFSPSQFVEWAKKQTQLATERQSRNSDCFRFGDCFRSPIPFSGAPLITET